jgi:glc operon protein GlcG
MTRIRHLAVAGTFTGMAITSTMAQQATPPYGAPISLEQAKRVIAAAEPEAQKNNWPVAITVVDSGGYAVAMHRMDNTQLGSIEPPRTRRARPSSSGGRPKPLRMRLQAAGLAYAF